MAAWLAAAAELVRPLVERMGERVRTSKVVHTDDTRVPIQSPGEGKCRNGRIWAYIGDRRTRTSSTTTRPTERAPVRRIGCASFKGYLQADAYGGYDGIYHGGERDGGRLLGACAPQVLRRQGYRRQARCRRCSRWSASCMPLKSKPRNLTTTARRRTSPSAERAGARSHQDVARCRAADRLAPEPDGGGDHLCLEPVGRACAFTPRKVFWPSTTTPPSGR